MPLRTFLALDIDESLRSRLAEAQAKLGALGGKVTWVKPVNLHVTLNFLGDVADELIADVCGMAAEVAAQTEPFEFHVASISCIPPRGPLRMVWAAMDDPTGRMAELSEHLGLALDDLGLRQEDRRFKGHITLARVKYVQDASALRAAAADCRVDDFPIQHADELIAYTSQLTPEGSIYTPIARAPLGQ